jgi:hypothetical protein
LPCLHADVRRLGLGVDEEVGQGLAVRGQDRIRDELRTLGHLSRLTAAGWDDERADVRDPRQQVPVDGIGIRAGPTVHPFL